MNSAATVPTRPHPARTGAGRASVPLAVVAVLHGLDVLDEEEVAVAVESVVPVGDRLEIDTASLRNVSPQLADTLETYWARAQRLFAGTDIDWVGTNRTIASAVQVDNGSTRRDLGRELAALDRIEVLAPVLDALLGTEVDDAALSAAVGRLDGHVTVTDGVVSATVPVDGVRFFDPAIGGPAAPGEARRYITLSARHAKWRDRRARRLVQVTVTADEIWPAA